MSAGLYPLSVIAEFLGRRPEDMSKMIEVDGLPVIPVPTATKNINRVSLLGFHRWLVKRSVNRALTMDELEAELDRAARVVAERARAKQQRRKAQEAPAA